jgi:hypothetical protein
MDIKKYLNVLTKKEQSSILKLINKKLIQIPDCPGLQTHPNLHFCEELKPLFEKLKKYILENFTIDKCWANYTDGNYINWHVHKSDLSVVYYLKNKKSIGTVFRINGKIVSLKSPENSLIIFKNEIHSVPPKKRGTLKMNRYSIALELSLKM